MNFESYFEEVSDREILIRGTRVGIETVLLDFREGASPEEISVRYRCLSLEQVYAAITFYLHDRARLDAYLERHLAESEAGYQRQLASPSNVVARLRALKTAGRVARSLH
jgi:uncharacterized protein (DUF433 family)